MLPFLGRFRVHSKILRGAWRLGEKAGVVVSLGVSVSSNLTPSVGLYLDGGAKGSSWNKVREEKAHRHAAAATTLGQRRSSAPAAGSRESLQWSTSPLSQDR